MRFQPVTPSRQQELFVIGLQIAAGMLMAHQIAGKAARDGLFLFSYGPRALPAMIAGAAAFSMLLSFLAGRILLRLDPQTLVPWALLISGILQIGEWRLLGVQPALASLVIYLHMAGLGTVLLSAFWSMLNEKFDPREAKKRFGQIAAGGTIGGLVGGLAAERSVALFGTPPLMLGLAGLHLACGFFLASVNRRTETGQTEKSASRATAGNAWSAISGSTLLKTLAGVVLLGSAGTALLDYVFKVYAMEAFGRGPNLVRFFAFFHTGVAVLSFILQSVVAKPFLERLGLGKTILSLPGALLGGSFMALLLPSAVVTAAARAIEAAVRGSLFRAGYETCYTPISAGEKRVAKTFIDVVAERGGDLLGAGLVMLCLALAGASALVWILAIASLIGLASVLVCFTLESIYLKVLAQSLLDRAIELNPDSDLDLTTRSIVMRTRVLRGGRKWAAGRQQDLQDSNEIAGLVGADPVLQRLMDLRSADPVRVQDALMDNDIAHPVVATQICLLLGNDEHAVFAHGALFQAAGKVLGLLTDLMLDPALDVAVRRRLPRIIGSAGGQRAADSLMLGLEDQRFEIRLQCGRALNKLLREAPRLVVSPARVIAAVDAELSIGRVLWESHRRQQSDKGKFGPDWLDELLSEKADGSLEYVFSLLSILYDRRPLMTAFRSLHLEDKRLRGTALEYLEGVLPAKTRELLWENIQERPSHAAARHSDEVMDELLRSSETIMLRLRPDPSKGSK